ncbi:tetratricopeptide repeat protein [Dyadobacter jiangsuensis]|uniref:Tetratricopeptide repeat protein n=2 Tax=Dyadobacter jiangsuensis TaxID=1591085 RepID=A0A2P8G373_9BACT|nr:tetratricopeptide repeat protein [Dyadobacter jiangsuensis]
MCITMSRSYSEVKYAGLRLLLCLLLISSIDRPALATDEQGDVVFSPKLQKAYFEIQKLRLPAARELIDDERAINADNPFIAYLDSYADLHYLLIAEDRSRYKIFTQQQDKRLDQVGKLSEKSPYKRLFQADIRLHSAFAKLKFGNEVSGSWEIIKAYRLLEDNRKKFPPFTPTLKSLGLLHVLIGSIPENYTWIAKILGLKGNIAQGIRELREVVKEEPFFRQEAELIDLLLHAYTLQLSPEQQVRIRQWPKEQPDNLLLHFFATTVLMKENRSEEASHFLADAPVGKEYMPFPFLHYLRGEIALQNGDYDESFASYARFLKQYAGFNYIKDSYFKMFMCRWLAGRDQEATDYILKVTQKGSTIIEADQFAERVAKEFSEEKISPRQKVLYKARYATDGGYFQKAWELMKTVSEKTFATTYEKAEFNYRMARILQKSGRMNDCVPFYDRSIALGQTDAGAGGFAASSALQMGYIYQKKADNQKAIMYFKKAMSFKKHEYKNSIDNKARAALTELGQ